jgi:hypothetical protein
MFLEQEDFNEMEENFLSNQKHAYASSFVSMSMSMSTISKGCVSTNTNKIKEGSNARKLGKFVKLKQTYMDADTEKKTEAEAELRHTKPLIDSVPFFGVNKESPRQRKLISNRNKHISFYTVSFGFRNFLSSTAFGNIFQCGPFNTGTDSLHGFDINFVVNYPKNPHISVPQYFLSSFKMPF